MTRITALPNLAVLGCRWGRLLTETESARLKRRPLIDGIGIVVRAYSANAWFNHTTVGRDLKSHEGAYVLGFFLPFGVVLPALWLRLR